MKTYAELKGKESFDWNKFLENPPKYFSNEHFDACDLAEAWVTCACGNLCDIIPRNQIGSPVDEELQRLGIMFHLDIDDGQWQNAKTTLWLIEKRSAEIIFELTK
jgi:hypothetical protein